MWVFYPHPLRCSGEGQLNFFSANTGQVFHHRFHSKTAQPIARAGVVHSGMCFLRLQSPEVSTVQ